MAVTYPSSPDPTSEEAGWEERDDGTSLTLVADGVDVARKDEAELKSFLEDTQTPQDQALPRGVHVWWARIGFGLAFFSFPYALDACRGSDTLGPAVLVFLVGMGVLLRAFVVPAWRRAARERRSYEDRFTLSLDAEAFTFASTTRAPRRLPLGEIAAFEGGRKLTLVRPDGSRLELPCELGTEEAHRAIATRLDERRRRLGVEGGAYRGPRLAGELPDQADDEADGKAARQRSGS